MTQSHPIRRFGDPAIQDRDARSRSGRPSRPPGADPLAERLPGVGWSRGAPLKYLRELAEYWRTSYDWRQQEARINEFPQFATSIDGANLHFLHVRSPEPDALPLIVTHGWPGSVVEFLEVIGPLSDPRCTRRRRGGCLSPRHPVDPWLRLSGPTGEPGWTQRRIARAFAELMDRLGYDRYGAQGGDVGAQVSPDLGRVDPDHVVGVHVNAATVGSCRSRRSTTRSLPSSAIRAGARRADR